MTSKDGTESVTKINAIFVTDLRGLEFARYSIASFMTSQTDTVDITLYCDGFVFDDAEPLRAMAKAAGFKFATRPLNSKNYGAARRAAHISPASYMKFAAAIDASVGYDRVLYADIDILFFKPLPLRGLDFKGFPIAAAYDVAEVSNITNSGFTERSELHAVSTDYFNAGVIYIDVATCDLAAMSKAYDAVILKHQESCPYKIGCATGDQCIWNLLFQNQWLPLPITWNVQSSMRFTAPWETAAVRHYTGQIKFLPVKPWRSDAREAAYIKTLSRRLGENLHPPFNPLNILYRANGLRWFREIRAISRGVTDVTARIALPRKPLVRL